MGSPSVTDCWTPGRVYQKAWKLFLDGPLADRSLVIGQADALVHESDPLMTALGRVDDGALPGLRRQGTQATDHRGTTSADRDEVDAALVDAREFRVGDHLGIEEQPEGIVSRDLMPELDEPHQFSRLIGAGQVGVGVAHDPAALLLGEEAQDAGTG